MKEFNLEAAKSGAPVQTRDGRKARIICWDRLDVKCPILALVKTSDDCEGIGFYTEQGSLFIDEENPFDLVMAPVRHVKYVPLFKSDILNSYATGIMYDTEEEAERYGREVHRENFIKAVKIEWEEE